MEHLTFIDDSGKKFSDTVGKAGRIFNVGSGSLNLGTEKKQLVQNLQVVQQWTGLVNFIQTKEL